MNVLVVGAGPAGSIAALVLARAGASVRVIDRARFPRRKLCGDTVNPGARAILRRLGLESVEQRGTPIAGMIVSGNGVSVRGTYPRSLTGLAITREMLDVRLVEAAASAGALVDEERIATDLVVERGRVTGVRTAPLSGRASEIIRSDMCIAADGRHSRLAFSRGLAAHPRTPRRWAVGAYFEGTTDVGDFVEMHIRADYYVGVARVPGDRTNVCVVTTDRDWLRDPAALVNMVISTDPALRARFAESHRVSEAVSVGPLAVDARASGMPGLLLAGDSAGFIDPITGDGLRFAFRGGELAATAALAAFDSSSVVAHERLRQLRREFLPKRTFNRMIRLLVSSPGAVRAAAAGVRVAPFVLQHIINTAGDLRAA
jgi:flavin-dependent dehydrogenase